MVYCSCGLSYDVAYQILHDYTCHLLAANKDLKEDSLKEISKNGIASLAAQYGLAAVKDISRACEGTSSASTRILLLFVALSSDLQVEFAPTAGQEITTVSALTEYVLERLSSPSQLTGERG